MKLTFGSSKKGDVAEALKNITSPAALFFTVADEKMLAHTAIEIEKIFHLCGWDMKNRLFVTEVKKHFK